MAPIGAVFLDVPDECFVRLVDQRGEEVDATSTDGSTAVAVEMVDARSGEVVQTVPRNEQGGFYCIFQPNKYVLNSPGLGSLLSLAVRAPSSACSSGGRRCRLSLPRPQLRRYLKSLYHQLLSAFVPVRRLVEHDHPVTMLPPTGTASAADLSALLGADLLALPSVHLPADLRGHGLGVEDFFR